MMMSMLMAGDDDNDDDSDSGLTGRFEKGRCAWTCFPRSFFRPTDPNKLAPTFKIIVPTSVVAFSRKTGFAARFHRLSSGWCFRGLVPKLRV